MDGDIANLPEILKIGKENNAKVMVDGAHSTGVLGKKGSGIVAHFGLREKPEIEVGTLSKSLGGLGGHVAGRIARRSEAALGASVAVVGMVLGAFFREGGLPLWHDIVGFAAMIPCGIAGGRFAATYSKEKAGSQGS